MNEHMITLAEYESCEVQLSAGAYNALRSRYVGKIDVGVTERMGVYRITARDYVGRIGLPDGSTLVIRPKVGVANLFHMLCVEAGLASFYTRPTWLAPDAEIFPFVMELLVKRVGGLLRAGLYRAYVPVQEDLPFVRGRIALNEQLRLHGDLKDRHVCNYADLTADTAENRVILAALRLLPVLLRGMSASGGQDTGLVRRVRSMLPRFEGVAVVRRGQALVLARSISFHRLNAACAPAIDLCRLALQHLTLDERPGSHPFASFLVDMPRLFESFVTARLKAYLEHHGLRVVAQRHDYLDEGGQVGIRPDVLVYARGDVIPLLVLDAKYRRVDGEDGLNRDLYQVSAYLDRYGLSRGVLVYPQFGDAGGASLKLRGTPKSLHLLTLNLDTLGIEQLERNCAALAEEVARLSFGLKTEH